MVATDKLPGVLCTLVGEDIGVVGTAEDEFLAARASCMIQKAGRLLMKSTGSMERTSDIGVL